MEEEEGGREWRRRRRSSDFHWYFMAVFSMRNDKGLFRERFFSLTSCSKYSSFYTLTATARAKAISAMPAVLLQKDTTVTRCRNDKT